MPPGSSAHSRRGTPSADAARPASCGTGGRLRSCGAGSASKASPASASQSGRRKMAGSLGQGRDHQTVPVGQHLVVASGPDPPCRAPRAGSRRLRVSSDAVVLRRQAGLVQPVEDVAPLPVAGIGDAVGKAEGGCVVAQELVDLGGVPDVEPALLALAVGVERRRRRRPRPASRAAASRRSPRPWPRTAARPWPPSAEPSSSSSWALS